MSKRAVLWATAAVVGIAVAAAPPPAAHAAAGKPCRAQHKWPAYHTPGYKGVCHIGKLGPQQPLPAVKLGANGRWPQVLVDRAGTAHVVWIEDTGDATPDLLHYCRLKRGSSSCDNPTQTLPVSQPGDPAFNEDIAGARIVQVGEDGLVFLSHRYPNIVPKPDGTESDRTTYMWVSDDGGQTISGPVIVGDAEPSGGAIAFSGSRIGVISDTKTGGTFFQAIDPGSFTSTQINLGEGGPDRAYSGSLAVVGGLPIAAFADLNGNTFIRQWSGSGSPNDLGQWSQAQVSGTEPRLASGPAGAFLVTEPASGGRFDIRRLNGIQPGRAIKVKGSGAYRDFFEDASGNLHLGWVDRSQADKVLLERSSIGATRFDAERVVGRGKDDLSDVDLGTADDGGGFAVFTEGGSSQGFGNVVAEPFGNQAPTNKPGIGNRPGTGKDPDVTSTCQEVSYHAVQILSQWGCFQPVEGKPGVKVTRGLFKLNGLEVVPDPNVKVEVTTKQGEKHIDSDGAVVVQLRQGDSVFKLWHGELHIQLPAGDKGEKLFTVELSKFVPKIAGFEVNGDFNVLLKQHAVEIPVELKLPKVFGGLTAGATLVADNEHGLHVDSVHFKIPTLVLGPLELDDIEASWNPGEDSWTGGAGMHLFKAGFKVRVTFSQGKFEDGQVEISPRPYPGQELGPDVYLTAIRAGLHLGDESTSINGGASFAFQPLFDPDESYLYTLDSDVTITIAPRFAMDFKGTGKLGGLPISESKVHADSDGFFSFSGSAVADLDVIKGTASFAAYLDATKGEFGGKIQGSIDIGKSPFDVTLSEKGFFNNEMVAACAVPVGGFSYNFKTHEPDFTLIGCPDEPPIPGWVQQAGARAPGVVRAAQATGGQPRFTLSSGLSAASITVHGASGPPAVTLVAPGGGTIQPVAANSAGASGAPAVFSQGSAETVIGLRKPKGGDWTVQEATPGSVTSIDVTRDLPNPTATAHVSGRGYHRVLSYKATARKGLVVRFFERSGKGASQIGVGKAKSGRIKFQPLDGPGGKRPIEARFEQNGLPIAAKTVTSYRAPPPLRPARVKGLRVRRSGHGVTISWRRAKAAQQYVVRVFVSDGRGLLRLVKGHSLKIGGVARSESVRVTVSGRTADGRQGKAARAKLAKAHRHKRR